MSIGAGAAPDQSLTHWSQCPTTFDSAKVPTARVERLLAVPALKKSRVPNGLGKKLVNIITKKRQAVGRIFPAHLIVKTDRGFDLRLPKRTVVLLRLELVGPIDDGVGITAAAAQVARPAVAAHRPGVDIGRFVPEEALTLGVIDAIPDIT